MVTENRLPPKQDTFVTEYLTNGGNGAQAAIAAGYSHNYADRTAYRLLQKVEVSRAIERKQNAMQLKVEYSAAQWLEDQLRFQQEARADGSWSAVGKFSELVGRHIGALSDAGRLNRESAELFTMLGAAMERATNSQRQVAEAVEVPARELPESPE